MRKIFSTILLILVTWSLTGQTSDSDILTIIEKHRPLNGGAIPQDIKNRLGATHAGGKYYLTNEPFIIEGAKKIEELGFGVVKFFLSKEKGEMASYPYNSKWNLPKNATWVDVIKHPYFEKVLEMNFSTVILNITDHAGQLSLQAPNYNASSEEIYELGKFLLTRYKDRELTFIIKNWEGDWVLRGNFKQDWATYDENAKRLRVKNMTNWLESRQAAVEDARKDVKNTKSKLYLAVEANKVMDSMKGITGVANSILPNIKVDMVSWSSYDGLKNPVDFYKGIEYLKKQLNPTKYMQGKKTVMIGEIGIPENTEESKKTDITARWDALIGVCLALDVPYVVHWEVYCNEPKDGKQKQFYPVRTESEMKGLWLIKPDGTKGISCNYLQQVLQNAGGKLN